MHKVESLKSMTEQWQFSLEECQNALDTGIKGKVFFDISMDPYNHMMRILFGKWKPFIL